MFTLPFSPWQSVHSLALAGFGPTAAFRAPPLPGPPSRPAPARVHATGAPPFPPHHGGYLLLWRSTRSPDPAWRALSPLHPLVGFPPPPLRAVEEGLRGPRGWGGPTVPPRGGGVGAVPAPRTRCLQGVNRVGSRGGSSRRVVGGGDAGGVLLPPLPLVSQRWCLPAAARPGLAPAVCPPAARPWWPRRRCVSLDARLPAAAACSPSRVVRLLLLLPARRRGLADQP